jgi:hypothetical protein
MTGGAGLAAGEEGGAGRERAHVAAARVRGRGSGSSWAEGRSGPGAAHAGEGGEKRGAREGKERGGEELGRWERAGPRGLAAFFFSSFLTPKLFKQSI